MSFVGAEQFGAATKKDAHSAGDCLKFQERPPTPDRLKKFRDSFHEPGVSRSHYGTVTDPLPDVRFGRRIVKKEHASDLLGVRSDVSSLLNRGTPSRDDLLGRSVPRTQLPDHIREADRRYGATTTTSESAKGVIFPVDVPADSRRDLYKRSHASYEPGEQKNRAYHWTGTQVENPEQFRFGVTGTTNYAARDCFQDGSEGSAKVVSRAVKDHLKLTRAKVGEPRRGEIDPTMVFGRQTRPDDWGARECIHGDYGAFEQEPDDDVGRATRPGFRNLPPSGGTLEDVAYGAKKQGDEVSALASLRPSQYAHVGVNRTDFDKLMPKADLQEIVLRGHVCKTDEEFERLFGMAVRTHADDLKVVSLRDRVDVEGKCSIEIFKKTLFEDMRRKIYSARGQE